MNNQQGVSEFLFPLLGLDLAQVELQLLALKDVPVGPAALAGPGRNGGQDTAGHPLVEEGLLDLGLLLPLGVLLAGLAGALGVEDLLVGLAELGALLAAEREGVVGFIPRIS